MYFLSYVYHNTKVIDFLRRNKLISSNLQTQNQFSSIVDKTFYKEKNKLLTFSKNRNPDSVNIT